MEKFGSAVIARVSPERFREETGADPEAIPQLAAFLDGETLKIKTKAGKDRTVTGWIVGRTMDGYVLFLCLGEEADFITGKFDASGGNGPRKATVKLIK